MWIDSSGNLGIGTSSPSQKLDIADSQSGAVIAQVANNTSGATANAEFRVVNGDVTARLTAYSSSNTTRGGQVWFNVYRDWETDRKSTRLNSSHRL